MSPSGATAWGRFLRRVFCILRHSMPAPYVRRAILLPSQSSMMSKNVVFAFLVTVSAAFCARAQSTTSTITATSTGPVTAKLQVSQIKETVRLLGDVDIRGTEVDVFLNVRNTLSGALGRSGKADSDVIPVELSSAQAVNLDLLLTRSKATGADSVMISLVKAELKNAAAPARKKK